VIVPLDLSGFDVFERHPGIRQTVKPSERDPDSLFLTELFERSA
jgi:hypothetical protein